MNHLLSKSSNIWRIWEFRKQEIKKYRRPTILRRYKVRFLRIFLIMIRRCRLIIAISQGWSGRWRVILFIMHTWAGVRRGLIRSSRFSIVTYKKRCINLQALTKSQLYNTCVRSSPESTTIKRKDRTNTTSASQTSTAKQCLWSNQIMSMMISDSKFNQRNLNRSTKGRRLCASKGK